MTSECMCRWALRLQIMERLPLKVLEWWERMKFLLSLCLNPFVHQKKNAHKQHWSKGRKLTPCNINSVNDSLGKMEGLGTETLLMVQLLTGFHPTSLQRRHGKAHNDFGFWGSTQREWGVTPGRRQQSVFLCVCFTDDSRNLRICRNGCHSWKSPRRVLHPRRSEQGTKVGDGLESVEWTSLPREEEIKSRMKAFLPFNSLPLNSGSPV